MPCGQPKLSSMPSAPVSCVCLVISCQASRCRFHHQRDEERPVGISLLDPGDFSEIHFQRAIGDQLDIIEAHHLSPVVIDRAIARRDVDDRLARDRLPDRAAPAGVERAADLVFGIGRRGGGQPERIRRLDAAEFDRQVGHAHVRFLEKVYRAVSTGMDSPAPRSFHPARRRRLRRRCEGSRRRRRAWEHSS